MASQLRCSLLERITVFVAVSLLLVAYLIEVSRMTLDAFRRSDCIEVWCVFDLLFL